MEMLFLIEIFVTDLETVIPAIIHVRMKMKKWIKMKNKTKIYLVNRILDLKQSFKKS